MIKEYLGKVTSGEGLTENEASVVMSHIMDGQVTDAQIGALLIALKLKGETADEVAGFVRSMRAHAVRIEPKDVKTVDGCGTGGDGSHSFNISTAASIVAAAAGVTVAKHGNRSVSSKCGSADLLESAGGQIDPGPEKVLENINQIGFGFMFAPRFHPAMKHAIGPRREIGMRTVFNILGPMTSPAGVKRQVVGVFSKEIMDLMADVLSMTGSEKVLIVHSQDGMDEFSISAPSDYIEINNSNRVRKTITTSEVGLKRHDKKDIEGGDAAHNFEILKDVLSGANREACFEAVLFNAGAMIFVGDRSDSIAEGVELARRTISSGAAEAKLTAWIKASGQ